jgi:hypothetical protein
MMSEVWRVLSPRGRIAVLDQDWRDVMCRKPSTQASIVLRNDQLMLAYVERRMSPHLEKDTRYLVEPQSPLAQRLRAELGDKECAPTTLPREQVSPGDILDAWYDEAAQFDAETLADLVASNGCRQIKVDSVPLWGQAILRLTAIK